jgi:hypothetical protein
LAKPYPISPRLIRLKFCALIFCCFSSSSSSSRSANCSAASSSRDLPRPHLIFFSSTIWPLRLKRSSSGTLFLDLWISHSCYLVLIPHETDYLDVKRNFFGDAPESKGQLVLVVIARFLRQFVSHRQRHGICWYIIGGIDVRLLHHVVDDNWSSRRRRQQHVTVVYAVDTAEEDLLFLTESQVLVVADVDASGTSQTRRFGHHRRFDQRSVAAARSPDGHQRRYSTDGGAHDLGGGQDGFGDFNRAYHQRSAFSALVVTNVFAGAEAAVAPHPPERVSLEDGVEKRTDLRGSTYHTQGYH